MVSKRKASTSGNNALTYWHGEIDKCRPVSSKFNSYDELILDAHRWGEAMVRAEMQCMAEDGRSAADRLKLLRSQGQGWYGRGYRFFLLPRSAGAPKFIAHHAHTNAHLNEHARTAPDTLYRLAATASHRWWTTHARPIVDAAVVCEQEEAHRIRQRLAAAQAAQLRTSRPPPRTPTILSPTAPSPATMVASKGPALDLPPRLKRLLDCPAELQTSAPRAGIREQVDAAFRDQRILRVWDAEDGSGRQLTLLDKRAFSLQFELQACDLQALYGGGDRKSNEAALQGAGLGMIGRGGFNAIWGVRRPSQRLAALLPPEVIKPFYAGKLVLRSPHGHAEWVPRAQAVGEATNMLFTALCGFGPRVAAIACARRLESEAFKPENHDGTAVRYRLFAFIECATQSVDRRYAAETAVKALRASAVLSRPYYDALLVAIYQMSHEGFVHLDATLRNFVDFYEADLPARITACAVRVIDVEPTCFRRLCPAPTTEWRYLFLFNLLVVLVFLKVQLAGAWDPTIHWFRVRRACELLISELPGTTNIAALVGWQGTFVPWSPYPDLAKGEYAGDTHQATARAASHQLQHYLMQQPLDWGNRDYVRVVKNQRSSVEEVRKAKEWYERVYRGHLVPPRLFFLRAFEAHGRPRRFVEVAYEFLETPHGELQRKYAGCARAVVEHRPERPDHGRDFLLGNV
jgi:hypothetical protein